MSRASVSPPRWWRTPPWPPPELSPVPLHRCDVLPPSFAPFRLVGPGARRLPAAGEKAGLSPPQVFEMEGGLLPVRPRINGGGGSEKQVDGGIQRETTLQHQGEFRAGRSDQIAFEQALPVEYRVAQLAWRVEFPIADPGKGLIAGA